MRRLLPLLLSLALLAGCQTIVVWLEDGPAANDDDVSDDDDASTDDDDAGSDDDDASDDDDSAPTDPCPLPVPDHVVLDQEVWGETFWPFYVPDAGWALASLHASRMLDGLAAQQIDLRLSPSWFFALSLEATFMGCSDDTPADPLDASNEYPRRTEFDSEGCFTLHRGVHFEELCRLFDDDMGCGEPGSGWDSRFAAMIPSTDQAVTGLDNVEPGLLLTAWYTVYSYAILQRLAIQPDAWFAAAADPDALLALMTVTHFQSAWSGYTADAIADCQDVSVLDCLAADPWLQGQAESVAGVTRSLEAGIAAGSCYDRPLTEGEVADYCAALEVMLPEVDWPAACAAAQQARGAAAEAAGTDSFQRTAGAVLDALDEASGVRLRCPGAELEFWYSPIGCPE